MSSPLLRPAIFLDRDGVIIENKADYVRAVAEVKFIPGALEAIARLAAGQWQLVIITNQSGIGRGLITRATVDEVNAHIVTQIVAAGGRIDGIYVCPHHPQAGCACRKPAPGMLLDAARDLQLDLTASVMIGDALTDLQAARAVGVQPFLVFSGATSSVNFDPAHFAHPQLAADLGEATDKIISFQAN